MCYVEVERNVKLFVQDINPQGRKTIVLIHGWPVDHRMFEYQLNVLPNCGYRCVAIDLRGFGNSSRPWKGYSYNSLADDIYKVISTLQLNNVVLVGFSMGGAIAIRYMARHKGYGVSKLILMAAAAPSFTKSINNPYGKEINEVNQIIEQTYVNRPQMVTDFGSMFFASRITPSFRQWFQGLGIDASSYATIKTAESLRDEDVGADFQHIHVPTGIFHGILDKICPFEFALLMKQGIRNSQLFRFEHSGHGVFYDELETFNFLLLQFLDQ